MAGDEEDYGSARITVDLDDAQAVSDARDLGLRIARALDRATRTVGTTIRRNIRRGLNAAGAITVPIEPDLRGFDRALVRGLSHINGINVPVIPDLRRFDRVLVAGLNDLDGINIPIIPDLRRFDALLLSGLRGLEIRIPVVPDLDGFDARIRAHRPPEVPVPVNPNVDNNRLTRALSGLGGIAARVGKGLLSALKFGAIGIAAAGAAAGVGKFVVALAPAAGLLAAVPAAALGFQAALGGLKLALAGVSDAFQSALTGDAKAFEKSLENLSPKAQTAAREVRALKPAFESLRNSVQDAFFGQIEGQITATAKALQGPLKSGLTSVAEGWGAAAKNALGYIKGAQGVANVRSILGGASQAVTGLSQTTNKLTAGLLQVAAVVSDKFGAELAGGISNLGQRFGEWLQGIAQGGQAVAWVDGALNTLAQLGDLAGNVGRIIGGIFKAGETAGAGFLGNLQTITQSISDFVNSAQGQTALQNLFATVGTIAAQLGPIISALVTQLGGIAPSLAPIFTAIGPAIVNLVNALGPALAQIAPHLQTVGKALADGLGRIDLGSLGSAIGSTLSALAPLLPLAGQLVSVLASALAPVLQNLATLFQPIISSLVGALLPVLPGIATAFSQLATAMLPLAAGVGQAVAQLFVSLAPLLSALVGSLVQVSSALVPVVTALIGALLPALPPLIDAFTAVVAAVIPLLPSLAGLVAAVAPLVVMVIRLAAPVLRIAAAFAGWLAIKIVVPVIQAVVGVLTGLIDGLAAVVSFVVSLPGRISDGLSAVAEFFRGAFEDAKSAVSSGIDAVAGFFTGLPGKITSGLSSLGSTIGQFFVTAFETAKTGLSTAVQAIVDFFVALPGRIVAGLAALPGLLVSAFTSAVALVIIGLLTVVAGIVFVFTELPGKIYNALVSLGTFLINAFVSGFNIVTSTISGWISATVGFFKALPGRAYNALVAIGSFLIRAFTAGFNAVTSTVSGWISATIGFFRALPGRILSALTTLGSFLLRSFTSAFNRARNATTNGISAVVGFFRGLPGKIGSVLTALPGKISSAFSTAASKARSAASSLISGVVNLFSSLGSKIVGAMGNVGAQIVSKVKSGLPSAVRKYLPFAKGGIVYGPTHALIGEAGPEVVIPLTKPKRAMDLAARSGLLGILGVQQASTLAAANGGSAAAVSSGVSDLRKALSGIAALLDGIGADVVAGMVAGIKGNTRSIVLAAQDMAGTAVTAAKDTLGIASPSKVFAKIGTDTGRGFIAGLTGTSAKIKATTDKLAKDIIAAFSGKKSRLDDRLVRLVDAGNKRLQSLAAQRDALTKRIADAQKFAAETTQKALDAFSLANLTQGTDKVTAKSLTAGLEAAVARVKTFQSQLNNLVRRGLSKSLLQQIIGLGPDQGSAIATALAGSTKDSLKRLNSLQSQLTKASTTLGRTSADVLFDAGKNAGAGFLAGLKGQRKSIEKLMLDIAKGMQAAIRTALKIRSPSRVMMRIGDMTGAGLHIGLLRRLAALQDASRVAARSLADGVAAQLSGIGKGGDVIPLTRAQRSRMAGAEGRPGIGRGALGAGTTIVNNWEIREVGNADVTAHRVLSRLVHAAGVTG
ncbi:hypothetical protein [Streptomyces canus]|uniref:hypothetical protein n=1 Tax=Streptomyces canus TaxID=58343 RepID=UPI002E252351